MKNMVALAVALAGLAPATARAAVKTQEVEYKQGETALQGFFAWDDAVKGKRPGILVVHEWWGHNEHARNQARRLAEAGYVGFALDMYGKGKLATHPEDAQAFMAEATRDPAVLKARFDAALAVLKSNEHVDPQRVGAIGYCFGGAVVLSMARLGEDLDAVASFHGALGATAPISGAIHPRILVAAGADDPMVPPAQVDKFEKEMTGAGAKIEVIRYPGAKHGFTNPEAGKYGMDALAYDAEADRKSWEALLKMLKEVFKA